MKKIIILFGFVLCTAQLTAQTTYYRKVLIQNSDGTYREALIEQSQPSVDFGSEPQIYSGTQNNQQQSHTADELIAIEQSKQRTLRYIIRANRSATVRDIINTAPVLYNGNYFPIRNRNWNWQNNYINAQQRVYWDALKGQWLSQRGVW